MEVKLKPTQDILAGMGERKKSSQVLVGFALETENELEYASEKLQRKKLDFIVLNSLRDAGAGFGVDTNKVTVLSATGSRLDLPVKTKKEVAHDLVDLWSSVIQSS